MDLYVFCMGLGFVGLLVMTASGMGHHGAGGHAQGGHLHTGHGHAGHLHAAGHHHGTGHAAHGQHGHERGEDSPGTLQTGSTLSTSLIAWLSPRVLFSILLGFGATGILIHNLIHEPWTLVLAALGGLGFEKLIVGPLWNLLLGFASKPARTLESAVAEEARAVSNFDPEGQGLITLELDGQRIQVLGTLRPDDRAAGVRVRTGDRLFVESVDSRRNSCVVSSVGTGTVQV